MATSAVLEESKPDIWADEEIVSHILAGEIDLFAIIMRRYNARLYRVTFSILRDEAEAEDAMEEAYVRAYQHLDQFAGLAKFSTWLTRIAVNEALARKRHSRRHESLDDTDEEHSGRELVCPAPNPEQVFARREVATSLESAILALPENYRLVFVVREVHELSVAETAECLGLSEENVKIRLYRARAALRRQLSEGSSDALPRAFLFASSRNDSLKMSVLARVRVLNILPSLRA